MKQKLALIAALLTAFSFDAVAQQATVSSGNNANGSGGSSSYTVGQVVYTANSGSNGSVYQGVQQPYEISTLGTDEFPEINLNFSAYPNPTDEMLTLSVENYDTTELQFQLFDVAGKLVNSNKLSGSQTQINMRGNAKGMYLLSITKNSKTIKTFKIIRN